MDSEFAVATRQIMKPELWISLLGIAASLTPTSADAAIYTFDFDGSFEGWNWQWDLSEGGPGVVPGEVSLSNVRGSGDNASLLFDMGNGAADDGTLWIEKAFDVSPNTPSLITVSFDQFNLMQSDMNRFEVRAMIGDFDPQIQADFAVIGETGTNTGWVPFTYQQTVNSAGGQAYVALGIRVAWEARRQYWVDHVQVNVVPEPSSIAMLLGCFAFVVGLKVCRNQSLARRSVGQGSCRIARGE